MILRQPARVRTQDQDGTMKLDAEPAVIGPPTPEQQNRYGGVIRHRVNLNPGRDIVPGDWLFILSWDGQVVDPAKRYFVAEVQPSGSGRLAKLDVLISEKVLR